MSYIDTHAHIYLDEFNDDLGATIQRAGDAGLSKVLMPNIDSDTIAAIKRVANQYVDFCYPMMGLHPCSVDDKFDGELKLIEEELRTGGYLAVGEIGTDLYWEKKYWDQQKEVFLTQIEWAKELKLPVVIHCRDSLDATIEMVRRAEDENLRGVFHCFSGTVEQAKQIEELGFCMGIGGVSTFKNGGLDKVLPSINLNHIVLETDSPYLAPVPNRGKRNEPSYIPIIAKRIAEIYDISLEEVERATTLNAKNLFGI